jgi:ATP/maltotriose-dependent transcriptional regulator MalT
VVHAALGHHRKAQSSLATARHFLDEAAEPAANAGPPLYRHAELAFDTSLVLQESGDLDGAVAAVRGAFRHTPPRERYTRATATARLAELWLRTGHVDQACRAIHELLDDHAYLYSARMDATVAELRAHLERHSRDPGVRQVLRRFRRHRGNTRTTPEGAA